MTCCDRIIRIGMLDLCIIHEFACIIVDLDRSVNDLGSLYLKCVLDNHVTCSCALFCIGNNYGIMTGFSYFVGCLIGCLFDFKSRSLIYDVDTVVLSLFLSILTFCSCNVYDILIMKGWICEDYCIEYFQLIFDCHIHTGINRERIVCSLLNLSSVEIFSIQSDIDLGDLHAFLLECICYNYLFCSDVVAKFTDCQFVLSLFTDLIFYFIGFLNNVKGWSVNKNLMLVLYRDIFLGVGNYGIMDTLSCKILICDLYGIFKCQFGFFVDS